jgi:hypothetical protein
MFISTLFTGNDFWDSIHLSDFFTGRVPTERAGLYTKRIHKVATKWPVRIAQGFNQAFRFRHMPEEAELAVTAAVAFHIEMARLCEIHGIRFVTVVLPTKADVDGEDDRESYREILDALHLSDYDYAVSARLASRFIASLEANGITCIDATNALRDGKGPYYWRKDHHLNVEGHKLVARLLFDTLRHEIP